MITKIIGMPLHSSHLLLEISDNHVFSFDGLFHVNIILFISLHNDSVQISCPMMNAGPKYEYRWADGIRYKKPIGTNLIGNISHHHLTSKNILKYDKI